MGGKYMRQAGSINEYTEETESGSDSQNQHDAPALRNPVTQTTCQ